MNVLMLGDVVGKPGRKALESLLKEIKKEHSIDFCVINAENSAGGSGLTVRIAKHFFSIGSDCLTLGDHVWDQKELELYLNETDKVLRPANFPKETPGKGYTILETEAGVKVGIINLLGRVFIRYNVDCPFRKADELIEEIKKQTPIILVDFHAETTSEKVALGHYLDGRVSAVIGTHTHIQTADEIILPNKTAYITDLGMTGPYDSVIGQNKENIIQRFLMSMPVKFCVAEDGIKICGVIIEIDDKTGKAKSIKRIQHDFLEKDIYKTKT